MELRSQIWASTMESLTTTGQVSVTAIRNQTGADEAEVRSTLNEMVEMGWLRDTPTGRYLPGRMARTTLDTPTKLATSSF